MGLTVILSLARQFWPYLVAGSVGFGSAWYIQGLRITAAVNEFTAYRLSVTENSLKAAEANRAKEIEFANKLQEARIDAESWKKKADDFNSKWRVASGKLRDTTANIESRVSEATKEACVNVVRTYGTILQSCDAEQSEMARRADECLASYIELDKAWPE